VDIFCAPINEVKKNKHFDTYNFEQTSNIEDSICRHQRGNVVSPLKTGTIVESLPVRTN
jgi:hypothetical protein